jgi:hypothetical protein
LNEVLDEPNPQDLLFTDFDLDAVDYEIWQTSKIAWVDGNGQPLEGK